VAPPPVPDLDRAALHATLDEAGGDPELGTELVALFADDAGGRLREAHEAVLAADRGALGRAAHALKGTSSTLGAARVNGLARDLEAAARAGDLAGVPALVAALDAAVPAALAALAAELDLDPMEVSP
jgi:HPt (histidine-containing phosphotransfer) domain-containing protein